MSKKTNENPRNCAPSTCSARFRCVLPYRSARPRDLGYDVFRVSVSSLIITSCSNLLAFLLSSSGSATSRALVYIDTRVLLNVFCLVSVFANYSPFSSKITSVVHKEVCQFPLFQPLPLPALFQVVKRIRIRTPGTAVFKNNGGPKRECFPRVKRLPSPLGKAGGVT